MTFCFGLPNFHIFNGYLRIFSEPLSYQFTTLVVFLIEFSSEMLRVCVGLTRRSFSASVISPSKELSGLDKLLSKKAGSKRVSETHAAARSSIQINRAYEA